MGVDHRPKIGPLREIARHKVLYLMLVPAAIWFIVFQYIPMAGLVLAFKKFEYAKGMFLSPWNGFENFRFFFQSGKAWLVTRNTILYNLTFIVVGVIAQVSVAIFINEVGSRLFAKGVQTLLFLPYFISWVLVGAFVYNLLNYEHGVVNSVLVSIGFERFNAYTNPGFWRFVLVFADLWKWTGYGAIIYLAAITALEPSLFESARIDGANIFQQVRHITLPLLVPTILILVLLNIGRILRGDFEMFYQIIGDNGNLFNATDVVDTFVFRALIRTFNIGMASAAGFYQSVVSFVTVVLANRLVRTVEPDNALF